MIGAAMVGVDAAVGFVDVDPVVIDADMIARSFDGVAVGEVVVVNPE